jgi:hypothetical protein
MYVQCPLHNKIAVIQPEVRVIERADRDYLKVVLILAVGESANNNLSVISCRHFYEKLRF